MLTGPDSPTNSMRPTTTQHLGANPPQARGHVHDLNGRKRAFVQKHPAARPAAGASPVRGIAQPQPSAACRGGFVLPVCIQSMGWPNLDSTRGTQNSTRPPHRAEPAAAESRQSPPRETGPAALERAARLVGHWRRRGRLFTHRERSCLVTRARPPLSSVLYCVVTCRSPLTFVDGVLVLPRSSAFGFVSGAATAAGGASAAHGRRRLVFLWSPPLSTALGACRPLSDAPTGWE